ncbi:DUF3889 domain-containing protein [Amphibacillus sediminis]|uniref:DUF3889 domain-containing protein n=1 Tax=Amphibacillus sediminis TaxID=360185 RepID=UPI00082D9C9E|nr:DUF3889 domain-containing protein [Amphibacillus sediminis]
MNPYYINQNQYVNFYPYQLPSFDGYLPYQSTTWQRQNMIRGQATWTDGGERTQCGIPWSHNQYMTVAVSTTAPYQCGQTLKVRNLDDPSDREVIVTIVDRVQGYPNNKINLHRRAFQALGANLAQGVINIEFEPTPQLEEERWGKYLLELAQVAYPSYQVSDYQFVSRTQPSANQVKEEYDYVLQSMQETVRVRGTVIYNPTTERVIAFDIKEI